MKTILDAIGNTPLINIEGIWVKMEYLNPSGSIKARMAKYMIEQRRKFCNRLLYARKKFKVFYTLYIVTRKSHIDYSVSVEEERPRFIDNPLTSIHRLVNYNMLR